ncbi:hypothetical protein CROQUDRAFT_87249 [Cronartium quercuum f. sp. fusiforme G11]|uniref:Uncharacterized protein n=1 Tax=Cronartium quercuum f. sp. fusiforme G11 TaxID=708437 RepID=A0A9P6NT34_9BASI|nr:hypothetical protein CROQUDRAFT_87249 [Cronartium quercuum f. sp. fusiforme G11]
MPPPPSTAPLKELHRQKLGGNIGAKIVETYCLPLCQNTNTSPMQCRLGFAYPNPTLP